MATALQVASSNQYAYINSAPAITGGIILSGWCKIDHTPAGYPWTKGNDYAFVLTGSNWQVQMVCGNVAGGTNSATDAQVNVNSMLFGNGTYVNDYTFFASNGLPEQMTTGWTWNCWQIIMNGTADIVIRQWTRFDNIAELLYRESIITVASVRTAIGDGAWTPGSATGIEIGRNMSGALSAFMTRARVGTGTSAPTRAALHAIANKSDADTSAWADYAFEHNGTSAVLTDRSGNGRDLTASGTLAAGAALPNVVSTGLKLVQDAAEVSGTAATLNCSFEVLPTVGNLVVVVGSAELGTAPSFSDNQSGNSWTTLYGNPPSGNKPFIAWCVVNASTGTFTIQGSGLGTTNNRYRAFEWTNNHAQQPDWLCAPATESPILTLVAPVVDSYDGSLIVTSGINTTEYDNIYLPDGWVGWGDQSGGTSNFFTGLGGQKLTTTKARQRAEWARVNPSNDKMAAVMVGFRPYVAPVVESRTVSLGMFDVNLRSSTLFDNDLVVESWFDRDWIQTAASGGQSIAVAQVAETNLAQSIAVVLGALTISLGQISETDAAQNITPNQSTTVAVGQVVETDVAQAITPIPGAVSVAVGQVTETDLAQAITVFTSNGVAVGQAAEADSAQAINALASISLAVGQVTETDLAQAITPTPGAVAVSVAQASETDMTQTITPSSGGAVVTVGQAAEADLSQAVSVVVGAVSVAVGQSAETDIAQAMTVLQGYNVAVSQASEADAAQPVTPLLGVVNVAVGQVVETESAQSITARLEIVVTVDQAAESDSSQTITPVFGAISASVGQVVESDIAQAITAQQAGVVAIDQAAETDAAQIIVPILGIVILGRLVAARSNSLPGFRNNSITGSRPLQSGGACRRPRN